MVPLGLRNLNDEERHVSAQFFGLLSATPSDRQKLFSSSVNSPLKPPPQTGAKETAQLGSIGTRKSSINQSHLNAFHSASPGSGKPAPRRRETGESISGANPLSPTTAGRSFRDEPMATPPASLLRRKTDLKEGGSESKGEQDTPAREAGAESGTPFSSLKRSTTGPLSAGLNPPSSPWSTGPQSANLSSMGVFGNFSLGPSPSSQDTTEKKPGLGSLRSESRFKSLMSKTSTEDLSPSVKEKSSFGALGRVLETESPSSHPPWDDRRTTRPIRSDTNPYGDELPRTGSAALGGSDESPPNQSLNEPSYGAPRQSSGLGHHHGSQIRSFANDPMSPTDTNPYASPDDEKIEMNRPDPDNSDGDPAFFPSFNHLRDGSMRSSFGLERRDISSAFSDMGQTTSAGPNRGFPSLSGLGGLGSLVSGPWSSATPTKDRHAFSGFGDGIFGTVGDLQSASAAGSGFFGSPGVLGQSRSSRMSSLLPQAMQDQMRGDKPRAERMGDASERPSDLPFNMVGTRNEPFATRKDIDTSFRDSESMFRDFESSEASNRGLRSSEDMPFPSQTSQSFGVSTNIHPSAPDSGTLSQSILLKESLPLTGHEPGSSSESPPSSQLPTAQQRTMVMPDRMRWIYRDPQGNTQGPFSGLEMHDWFKAGFFTAELQVKKLEDAEYEPLAQLVRRIGNSREPFLVPQIGVPHIPASTQGSQWGAPANNPPPSSHPGAAQPPFASSFPSFGTTLTAEQQNALERRKQEEQYLMARQKEHLAQQQVMMKQYNLAGGPHGLHPALQHHSSAQSLHSQPSFGSITSPQGFQPSPTQVPMQPPSSMPSYLEGHPRHPLAPNLGSGVPGGDFRGPLEEELPPFVERVNLNRGNQMSYGPGPIGGRFPEAGTIGTMLEDRARLHAEQQAQDALARRDHDSEARDANDRLHQFQALRNPADADLEYRDSQEVLGQPMRFHHGPSAQDLSHQLSKGHDTDIQTTLDPVGKHFHQVNENSAPLSEDEVQAESLSDSSDSAWVKVDDLAASKVPPRQAISPLPAPAAQRNRQNVADNLAAETRSQSQTPTDTPTASVAPWAEKSAEPAKGPSLKEIQEAEARKAARDEEIAAAARKAQAEQERQSAPIQPAPGLPQTSTWAASTGTPSGSAASVWSKPSTGKVAAAVPAPATRKTLAQIQKEEEVRKQRQATAAANVQSANVSIASQGKRYADLAGKISTPTPAASGVWTTVGSSGKAKPPPTVVATPQLGARATSGTLHSTGLPQKTKPSAQPNRSLTSTSISSNQSKATEEFLKWARSALGKGLNSSLNGK